MCHDHYDEPPGPEFDEYDRDYNAWLDSLESQEEHALGDDGVSEDDREWAFNKRRENDR